MRSFFRLSKVFNPTKIAMSALFGGMVAYQSYQHAFARDGKPFSTEYEKHLQETLHQKSPNAAFFENVAIFSGNSNLPLAEEICANLGTKLGNITVGRFADGEVNIQVQDNIRGKDVFIIQPTGPPVNENLMELLLLVSTMRRASARKITVVVPYYGYCRQDRKTLPRVPISAADVARLLETVGVDRVIAIDLHCGQIQGFFGPRVPVDNLEANVTAVTYLKTQDLSNHLTVVSPDAGGVTRAKKFQEMLKAENQQKSVGLAMIIKHRDAPGKIADMFLVGNVADSDVIIIDDMIDTAGTLCEAAKVLKTKGAGKVYAFATHGLFSGKAFDNINKSPLEQVLVTDTILPKPGENGVDKITRLSVAPLLAEAIRRIQARESVSDLFANQKKSAK
jgi:ribose-phosphate pyrophosphokinase